MNSRNLNRAARAHLARVKDTHCALCDAPPPVSAHHIKQGCHFVSIGLCWDCHQGPSGWHGTKALWRVRKMDELQALNVTISRLT